MPSNLQKNIKTALSKFLLSRINEEGDIAIDVLRAIRDESTLWMERQLIWDAIDSDPFEMFRDDDEAKKELDRFKNMMNVLSCSRSSVRDGTVHNQAVLELQKAVQGDSAETVDAEDSLRLTFEFERRPIPLHDNNDDEEFTIHHKDKSGHVDSDENDGATPETEMTSESVSRCSVVDKSRKRKHDDDNGSSNQNSSQDTSKEQNRPSKCSNHRSEGKNGTLLTYNIDVSRDHGKKERLITIEVIASGDRPSVLEAIPMEDVNEGDDGDDDGDDNWEDIDGNDSDGDGNIVDANNSNRAIHAIENGSDPPTRQSQAGVQTKGSLENDGRDRYAAYVDPDVMTNFLSWTKLNFDEAAMIHILMTFPFYEHEWDIFGFLMDSVFGSEEEEMDADVGNDNDSDGEDIITFDENGEKCS